MVFPDRRNPAEVRAHMQTTYDAYMGGRRIFPAVPPSAVAHPERYPRKTQQVAEALRFEWALIDDDLQAYQAAANLVSEDLEKSGNHKPIILAAEVGLHAARVGVVQLVEGAAKAEGRSRVAPMYEVADMFTKTRFGCHVGVFWNVPPEFEPKDNERLFPFDTSYTRQGVETTSRRYLYLAPGMPNLLAAA